MLREKTGPRYNLMMKNRPGELMKLTQFLLDASVNVNTLRIASLGNKASIQFSTTRECVLPTKFRRIQIL